MTDQAGFAIAYSVVVGAPMLVGIVAWRVQAGGRFARLLFALGVLFALTALSLSDDGTLYSIGRVAVWLVEPAVLLLILTFPSGHFTRASDRRLAIALVGVVAVLYLPTALIAEHFPEPSPFSGCDTDCPSNAFALFPGAAGFVDDVVQPLREVLAVLILLALTIAVVRRRAASPPLLRRAMTPVVVIALFQVVAFAGYQSARRDGSVTPTIEVLGWIFLFSLPAVALSFAAGLANRRLHLASTLEGLAWQLLVPAGSVDLRARLADTLEDPSLRVAFRVESEEGGWVDETGAPMRQPHDPRPGRRLVEVGADGRPVAIIDHDEALAPDPFLMDAAVAYGLVVVEKSRLIAELRGTLRKVTDLESAHASVAAVERRRIERDLHDGAQQRLLALRINLGLLSERLARDAPTHADELHELADQVDETIHAVRTLAYGRPPALLLEAGLRGALGVAAAEAALPAAVHADGLGRYPPEIESAVYFSCVEAMQNAVKHAHGATRVVIELTAGDALRFEVRDDGDGFPFDHVEGAGLRNIRNRLAAVGGRLDVHAEPGPGARLVGTIPNLPVAGSP